MINYVVFGLNKHNIRCSATNGNDKTTVQTKPEAENQIVSEILSLHIMSIES